MGVWRVMVVMVMAVVMLTGGHTIGLTGTRALAFAQCAALLQPLHVVVMAFLDPTDVLFEAQHLGSILAK